METSDDIAKQSNKAAVRYSPLQDTDKDFVVDASEKLSNVALQNPARSRTVPAYLSCHGAKSLNRTMQSFPGLT
jgi:hypothetical protein